MPEEHHKIHLGASQIPPSPAPLGRPLPQGEVKFGGHNEIS